MAGVYLVVKPDYKALDETILALENAPTRFNVLVDNIVTGRGGLQARVEKVLTPYPAPPRYPLRWKSARQRRAYFATRGFGKGIPYKRTGQLGKGWRVVYRPLRRNDGDGSLEITNIAPAARYVVGQDQQPFHADTGWIRIDRSPTLDVLQQQVTSDVSEAWLSVLNKKGR